MPNALPTFVLSLDASMARDVCDAHQYLLDKRRDLCACTWRAPQDRKTLDKIDETLSKIDAVILGDAMPDSVFGRLNPMLWTIYAVH